jgi:hypothetical protein
MAFTSLLHAVLDCQLQNGGTSHSYSFVCYSVGTANSKSTDLTDTVNFRKPYSQINVLIVTVGVE